EFVLSLGEASGLLRIADEIDRRAVALAARRDRLRDDSGSLPIDAGKLDRLDGLPPPNACQPSARNPILPALHEERVRGNLNGGLLLREQRGRCRRESRARERRRVRRRRGGGELRGRR